MAPVPETCYGPGMDVCDVLIVGAGIAGASAGYALASRRRVILLERESQPGYHATGRSAAMFTETYGNAAIRAITKASRAFLTMPPAGFTDYPLVMPRGAIHIGRADQREALEHAFEAGHALVPSVRRIGVDDILARVPVIRRDYVVGGVFEPDAMDIDVHAVHRGYLRGISAGGGRIVTSAEVLGLARVNGRWHVETSAGQFVAEIVINAAGAWCDEIGRMAGLRPIGLVPKRRTVITFDPPAGITVADWPVVLDVDEQFYFKPDAGRVLATPADETPMPPCDVQPEEMDIAVTVDRIERATSMAVGRIAAKWAGLRSFVPDKTLVAGFDAATDGFFWLAGQGGYGIQTSPAMGRIAAALVTGQPIPGDLADLGVTAAILDPARLR